MEGVVWRGDVTCLAGGKFLKAGHAGLSGVVFKLVDQTMEHFYRPAGENGFAVWIG